MGTKKPVVKTPIRTLHPKSFVIKISIYLVIVVYFDQLSGAFQPESWSKYFFHQLLGALVKKHKILFGSVLLGLTDVE